MSDVPDWFQQLVSQIAQNIKYNQHLSFKSEPIEVVPAAWSYYLRVKP